MQILSQRLVVPRSTEHRQHSQAKFPQQFAPFINKSAIDGAYICNVRTIPIDALAAILRDFNKTIHLAGEGQIRWLFFS